MIEHSIVTVTVTVPIMILVVSIIADSLNRLSTASVVMMVVMAVPLGA